MQYILSPFYWVILHFLVFCFTCDLGHIGSITARDAEELGMKVAGYDPGLSVQAALKLPRSLNLADSITAAVSGADFITLNMYRSVMLLEWTLYLLS